MMPPALLPIVMATIGVGGAIICVLLWGCLREIAAYRPIVQAYLQARCAAQGTPMRVPDPDEAPGKFYAPFTDEELGADED